MSTKIVPSSNLYFSLFWFYIQTRYALAFSKDSQLFYVLWFSISLSAHLPYAHLCLCIYDHDLSPYNLEYHLLPRTTFLIYAHTGFAKKCQGPSPHHAFATGFPNDLNKFPPDSFSKREKMKRLKCSFPSSPFEQLLYCHLTRIQFIARSFNINSISVFQ